MGRGIVSFLRNVKKWFPHVVDRVSHFKRHSFRWEMNVNPYCRYWILEAQQKEYWNLSFFFLKIFFTFGARNELVLNKKLLNFVRFVTFKGQVYIFILYLWLFYVEKKESTHCRISIVDTERVSPCLSVHSGYFLRFKKNAVVQ